MYTHICPNCNKDMLFISEIITDYDLDDSNPPEILLTQQKMYQCTICKTIIVDY